MNSRIVSDRESMTDVLQFLKNSQLPYEDIQITEDTLFITYHNDEGKLIGTGGLEFYTDHSLLRSLAVEKGQRGKAIGKQIVADLMSKAKARQVVDVYLLTETAHDFFQKIGFKDINRNEAPEAVKASSEFSSVCPVSASCMLYKF
jgi:amino-acid N-acetyltransferase